MAASRIADLKMLKKVLKLNRDFLNNLDLSFCLWILYCLESLNMTYNFKLKGERFTQTGG